MDYLSKEKYEELQAELEDLRINKRKDVAERLEFAKSLGDLSENAEYHTAREEQSEIEDRIKQLETLLKTSEIVAVHHSVVVEIGSSLKLEKGGDGSQHAFTVVGSEEADMSAGKISYQSPLGASLLGKKKGDVVAVNAPKGVIKYKILSIA